MAATFYNVSLQLCMSTSSTNNSCFGPPSSPILGPLPYLLLFWDMKSIRQHLKLIGGSQASDDYHSTWGMSTALLLFICPWNPMQCAKTLQTLPVYTYVMPAPGALTFPPTMNVHFLSPLVPLLSCLLPFVSQDASVSYNGKFWCWNWFRLQTLRSGAFSRRLLDGAARHQPAISHWNTFAKLPSERRDRCYERILLLETQYCGNKTQSVRHAHTLTQQYTCGTKT